MKKILITGAAGYIGTMLCTELVEEGYSVTAVDKLKYDKILFVISFTTKILHLLNCDKVKC